MSELNTNSLIIQSIFLGVFATLVMDLCNFLGKKVRLHQGGSYALIGRWIGGFYRGRFRYRNILESPALTNESTIGVVSHYCIGIALAFIYLVLSYYLTFNPRGIAWAVTYGTFTNILPWFIMFPAFGFGFLASQGPQGNQLLRTSFCNHLGYGAALAVGSLLL